MMKINDLISPLTFHKNLASRDSFEPANPDMPDWGEDIVTLSGTVAPLPTVQQVSELQGSEATRSGDKKTDDAQQVDQAIDKANRFFQGDNRTLQFIRDKDSDRIVIMIKDLKTDEVIRQIPSEAMLKLAKQLEQLQGTLFEGKV